MTKAMPDPTPFITNAIRENALGLKKASNDAGSVEQHSIPDQIAAERFNASKEAMSRRHRGVRIWRIVPPAAGGPARWAGLQTSSGGAPADPRPRCPRIMWVEAMPWYATHEP